MLSDFGQYIMRDPVAFTGSVAGIGAVAAGTCAWVVRKYRVSAGHFAALYEEANADVARYRERLTKAESERDEAKDRLNDVLAARLARERRDQNYEISDHLLLSWIEREGESVSVIYCGLANRALSRGSGELRSAALVAAEAYATSAISSWRQNTEALALLEEIRVLRSAETQPVIPLERALALMDSVGPPLDAMALEEAIKTAKEARRRYEQGNYRSALALADHAISLYSRTIGNRALPICEVLNLKAFALNGLERSNDAISVLSETLDRMESNTALGPLHHETLITKANLANFLTIANRAQEALPLVRDAVDKLESNPQIGPNAVVTLSASHVLGSTLQAVGRSAEALEVLRATFARRSENPQLGSDHTDTLVTAGSIGVILRAMGRHEEAIPVLQHALRRLTALPGIGPNHPDATHLRYHLTGALMLGDRTEEAKSMLQAVTEDITDSQNFEKSGLLSIRSKMMAIRLRDPISQSDLAEFDVMLSKMEDNPTIGPSYPDVLLSKATRARLLWRLGQFSEAVVAARLAFENLAANPNFGPDHRETLLARDTLKEYEAA